MAPPEQRDVLTVFHTIPLVLVGIVAGNVVAATLGGGVMRHYVGSWLGAGFAALALVVATLVAQSVARRRQERGVTTSERSQ